MQRPTTWRSAWRYSAADGVPFACEPRDVRREPARGGEQEVPGAAGRVDDGEPEQRLGRLLRVRRDGRCDDRLERAVEQHLHQAVGRVVAARGLARVALGLAAGGEGELRARPSVICGTSSRRLS